MPSRPTERGVSRSSRTRGGMRWTRRSVRRALAVADGEAVWFWRPEAGVKFARRQRVARMTGSTKRWSPGRARISRKPLRGECRMIPVPRCEYWCAYLLPICAHQASVTGLEESIPFCVIHSPGTCFCPGSAQGRRLMGFMRGTGRPICEQRDHIVGCVDNWCGGLT